MVSQTSAMATKIVPSTTICTPAGAPPRSTKFGRIAAKNTITLGLAIADDVSVAQQLGGTQGPCRAAEYDAGGGPTLADHPDAEVHEIGGADELHGVVHRSRPLDDRAEPDRHQQRLGVRATALPNTVSTAARRPWATARLTTNSTLGPGMMMIAKALAANARRAEVGGTGSDYGATSRAIARVPSCTSVKRVVSGEHPSRIRSGSRKSVMTPWSAARLRVIDAARGCRTEKCPPRRAASTGLGQSSPSASQRPIP